jgi:hypothetical protein
VSQFALVIIRSTLSKPSAHTTNDIQRKQRYTIEPRWNIQNIPDSVEHTTYNLTLQDTIRARRQSQAGPVRPSGCTALRSGAT